MKVDFLCDFVMCAVTFKNMQLPLHILLRVPEFLRDVIPHSEGHVKAVECPVEAMLLQLGLPVRLMHRYHRVRPTIELHAPVGY